MVHFVMGLVAFVCWGSCWDSRGRRDKERQAKILARTP